MELGVSEPLVLRGVQQHTSGAIAGERRHCRVGRVLFAGFGDGLKLNS